MMVTHEINIDLERGPAVGTTFVTIQGNLTADPDYTRFEETQTQLTKFRIAASKRRPTGQTDHNGKEIWEDTDQLYIDVDCWGELAANTRVSLRKGHPVTVTGKLVTESWQERPADGSASSGGQIRSKIMLKATQVSFDLSHFQVNSVKTTSVSNTLPGHRPLSVKSADGFDPNEGLDARAFDDDSAKDTSAEASASPTVKTSKTAQTAHAPAPF